MKSAKIVLQCAHSVDVLIHHTVLFVLTKFHKKPKPSPLKYRKSTLKISRVCVNFNKCVLKLNVIFVLCNEKEWQFHTNDGVFVNLRIFHFSAKLETSKFPYHLKSASMWTGFAKICPRPNKQIFILLKTRNLLVETKILWSQATEVEINGVDRIRTRWSLEPPSPDGGKNHYHTYYKPKKPLQQNNNKLRVHRNNCIMKIF